MGFRSNANVTLFGNVSQDAKTFESKGTGTSCIIFNLAVENTTKGEDGRSGADFYKVKAFGKMGEVMAAHCIKGAKLQVVGNLTMETWTDKNGAVRVTPAVNADSIVIAKYSENDTTTGNAGRSTAKPATAKPAEDEGLFD